MREWGHDELAEDLAASRRRAGEIAATRLSLGSFGTHGQMDVLFMRHSWTDPAVTCAEVKISRGDFLSDATSGKFTRYRPFCRYLYFATPKGLIKRSELPPRIGLYERSAKGWRTVKRATAEPMNPGDRLTVVTSILFKGHGRPTTVSRAQRIRDLLDVRDGVEHRELQEMAAQVGALVSREVRQARDAIRGSRREKWRLADLLGLTEDEVEDLGWWEIAGRVADLQPKAAGELAHLQREIDRAIMGLEGVRKSCERGETDVG